MLTGALLILAPLFLGFAIALACVPVAIASGFLLSFLSPVLMGVFLSLG